MAAKILFSSDDVKNRSSLSVGTQTEKAHVTLAMCSHETEKVAAFDMDRTAATRLIESLQAWLDSGLEASTLKGMN
jgi:hypothetical protein